MTSWSNPCLPEQSPPSSILPIHSPPCTPEDHLPTVMSPMGGGGDGWTRPRVCVSLTDPYQIIAPEIPLETLAVVQPLSCARFFATSWTAACQASPSFTISHSSLKLMTIESLMPSNNLILCHPLLFLPSIFPSIRVFSNESALHIRWPKYWSFSISPYKEYSGLIAFRIGWFGLFAVQGTLKSLLQHHSSKASVI